LALQVAGSIEKATSKRRISSNERRMSKERKFEILLFGIVPFAVRCSIRVKLHAKNNSFSILVLA